MLMVAFILLFAIFDIFKIQCLACVVLGIFISSIVFFISGAVINKHIERKISRVNSIVKKSIPKDILNRSLYSNLNSSDEIETLCCDIESVIFEVKASERIKNDFISSLSHELRTPLTAIKGWAETMKVGDLIDFSTVRKGLDIIVNEASRLSGIVDELLDFSTMANGRMILNMEIIDISAEVSDAIYLFKEKASIEEKKIIYNEPKLPIYVYGDKSKLRQVFINIIDNALKYTTSGGTINIGTYEKDNKIVVEVTDNGCGIPKSELANVTQKFYKANGSKKGFGIGLSVVKEIVDSHDGELKILSEKNIGTTVLISFNVVKSLEGEKS